MKTVNKISIITAFITLVTFGLSGPAMAATTPDLGAAARFGVLSSTFTITTATTVYGDVGYTTLSLPLLTVIGGSLFVPSPAQAGLDQGLALSNINGQVCDFAFAAGAIDLATDTTHGTIGVYTGGVYCIDGAVSIGTAGITLSGAGTFIFKTLGTSNALTTVDTSVVSLTGGASACDVFWAPTAKTTLGANTTFIGTIIDDAGITIGSTTSLIGRALTYGETVTSNTSTITNSCGGAAGTGNLYVIKTVVGGPILAAGFHLYVNYNGIVVGSGVGTGGIGDIYALTAGTYTVSEDTNVSYSQSLGTNCSNVTLLSGDIKTCVITNTYITPPSGGGGGSSLSKDVCLSGDYSASYYDGKCGIAPAIITGTVAVTGSVVIVTGTTGAVVVTRNNTTTGATTTSVIPGLPKTGLYIEKNTSQWNVIALVGGLMIFSISFVALLRKRSV